MNPIFFRVFTHLFIIFFLHQKAYASATQILNDTFYPNPAELSLIHDSKLLGGGVFILPEFKFKGTTLRGSGAARSVATDLLPYGLVAKRVNDALVFSLNVLPSAYGHLDWPEDSIVANQSTKTKVYYYRPGAQVGYQLTDQLAIGGGFNVEHNHLLELDFVVPHLGNQVNRVRGVNYSGDVGVYYKISPKHALTAAYYTGVDTFGNGTSVLNKTITPNTQLNITEAAILFVGLAHQINEQWFLEEKIYWSDWTIQKQIDLINSTTGTQIFPTRWKHVFSFQLSTRYALNDEYGLLGGFLYETNPAPLATNAIGYPLGPTGSVGTGLDWSLNKTLSVQGLYGYSTFLPNSHIIHTDSMGKVNANINVLMLQFTYKS